MIDYRSWIKTCKELGLNPNIVGENPFEIFPLGNYWVPLEFGDMKFPKKNMEQVLKIGQIIYNLETQIKNPPHYNHSSKKDKKELERDLKIEKILPILNESIEYWMSSGLEKSKLNIKTSIFHGKVFSGTKQFDFDEDLQEIEEELPWPER